MSTRAAYTFKDTDGTHHVYKHWDNYPTGAVLSIKNAIESAWDLPRFEADEFGTAFIAMNKSKSGGGLRLISNHDAIGGLEYRYVIECLNDELLITAFSIEDYGTYSEKQIFKGTLAEFEKFSVIYEAVN